jgi:protein-S-isoprenylcysteine O-methyltransferase Ste14
MYAAMTRAGTVWADIWLALRSLAWAVLLPGLFAGYLPWRYFGLANVDLRLSDPLHLAGVVCIGVGVLLLGACIWEFARSGRGTLSPLDPPRELVVRGLYRHVRNPMYLSVTTIVFGEFLLTGSAALLVYWAVWFIAVNIVVIGYEEPTLLRQFGAAYERYQSRVGRWLPRLRRSPLVAVITAAATGSGCSTPFGPNEVLELGAARAQWSARSFADYVFDTEHGCTFCRPDETGPVRITVRGGAISSVALLSTGESISPARWYTIEQMFELIPTFADRDGVDDVAVTYDQTLGHPASISVRYPEDWLDAGDSYTLSAVGPAP